MPASRSAKEICREDPTSISCKVATNRERRRKKREKEYGEKPKEETEAPKPEKTEETPEPISRFDRQAQLDALEKKAGSK